MTDVELVRYRFGDGESVVVEVEDRRPGAVRVGARDRLREARECLEENLTQIRDAARSVLATLREPDPPDEIKLVFGVKLTAEAGAIIARTGVEGNLGVEMVWKRPARGPA